MTINIGNSTYPGSGPVNQSELSLEHADDQELELEHHGWEHMRAALIAIVAGVIAFLTIVGNIMVSRAAKIWVKIFFFIHYTFFASNGPNDGGS